MKSLYSLTIAVVIFVLATEIIAKTDEYGRTVTTTEATQPTEATEATEPTEATEVTEAAMLDEEGAEVEEEEEEDGPGALAWMSMSIKEWLHKLGQLMQHVLPGGSSEEDEMEGSGESLEELGSGEMTTAILLEDMNVAAEEVAAVPVEETAADTELAAVAEPE